MYEAAIVNIQDSQLIDRAQTGNTDAFNQLMERHLDRVYAVALKIVKDPHEAEDVSQEVFIIVFRKIKSFRGEATFSTWLYRVTVNRALRHLKKQGRYKPMSDNNAFENQVDTRPSPEVVAIEEEKATMLRDAMKSLPEKQRTVLSLRVEHSLPFKEIAKIMGRSIGGVKANYFHAVRKIQTVFSGGN